MPLPELIGLGGYAQSGKDTVARFLFEDHGYHWTYMSRTLELALLALDPLVPADGVPAFSAPGPVLRYSELHRLVGYEASKRNPEVRGLLQRLGTDVGRDILGADTWVNATFVHIVDPAMADGVRYAVTGIRFQNELDAIHLRGGTSVWVDRGLEPVNKHASDNALGPDDFDLVLPNHGTLTDLRAAVIQLAAAMRATVTWSP